MKKVLAFLASGIVLSVLVLPSIGLAALPGDPGAALNTVGSTAGFTANQSLPVVIGNAIKVVFSLLGIIAVVIIVYSGWEWMMSGGDEKKIGAAKQRIIAAVVGAAIMLLAYSITNFILEKLGQVTA